MPTRGELKAAGTVSPRTGRVSTLVRVGHRAGDRWRPEDELRAALGPESGAVVDVSGERTILELNV